MQGGRSRISLAAMPAGVRLAAALFVGVILLFAVLAQANLWVRDGGGAMPSPEQVLWKYHGRPDTSRLHVVLDPELDPDSALAMYDYLGETETVRRMRRQTILDWVAAGASQAGWDDVAPILLAADLCAQCHAPDMDEDAPTFDGYADVLPYARQDEGMAWNALLVTAHNHLFGFTVLALLLALGVVAADLPGGLAAGLVVALFVAPLLDVGCWLATRAWGAPFHWGILAGGAVHGLATLAACLAVLRAALRGPRVRQGTGRPEADDAP